MFDPFPRLGPKRKELIKKSWAHLFREQILPDLPVQKIQTKYHEYTGRPTKELHAMVDPLDDVAIREVENFTCLVVRPVLANLNDIRRGIERHVPFSSQDLFNPDVYKLVAKISAAAAVALFLVAGYLTYQTVQREVKGTVSRINDSVIYNNHDLTVDVAVDGAVNFSGRGAHADGRYQVRFANIGGLSQVPEGPGVPAL